MFPTIDFRQATAIRGPVAFLALFVPLTSFADAVQWMPPPPHSAVSRLRMSDVGDPDTVWIGHVLTNTGLPGTPGGYGPFHIGRGPNRPGTGPGTSYNGVWTFDQLQPGETDSLQGWWPVICPFGSVGTSSFPDRNRPFFGFDYGNQGNYAGNQGPTAGRRTFGVTGYWHRDGGSAQAPLPAPGTNPAALTWAPLAGGASAWCGLRSHGDLSAQDVTTRGGTGNWFNQSVLEFNGNNNGAQIGSTSTSGTDKNFPGYGSQWDQMLYRDVSLADNASFNVSFKYRTNMSTGLMSDPASRVGWFDKDPLKVVAVGDGNFISSSDAAATQSSPVDSFVVYIGVPVEPVPNTPTTVNDDFQASDNIPRDVYDPKRRWFSEVIKINAPYRELLSKAGVNASQTFTANILGGSGSIVQDILDAQAGPGGIVRLVFRVKTNRGYDDEDSFVSTFTSGTAGAAIVDDVVVNGWAPSEGDFESAASIDNAGMRAGATRTSGSTTLTSAGLFGEVQVGHQVRGIGIPAGTTVTAKASSSSITLSTSATALTLTCTRTNGSTTLTSAGLFAGVVVGSGVSGTGIPAGTTVLSKATASQLTLSAAATASGSGPLDFSIYTEEAILGVPATAAWKSTGKPPGIYWHAHDVSTLNYDDPCGAITAPNRFCNLTGKVFTPGNHDLAEKPAGLFGANDQDRQNWLASPTINLMSNGPGDYNGMGIDSEIAQVTGDYNLFFDIYLNLLDNPNTGNGIRFAWQAYPATQPNGVRCWGEVKKQITFFFSTLRGCFQSFEFTGGAKASGNLITSNPNGTPDSIRVFIEHLARCFTTTLSSAECSPSTGAHSGLYLDNLSFALIDAASPPGLNVTVWDEFNDAFPVNANNIPPLSAAFDTTTAYVRTGFNSSPGNGTFFRHNIPGDSAIATANGANTRADMVFRILPGVGNFMTVGNRSTALRRLPCERPTGSTAACVAPVAAVGNASSANFWESYLADGGAFGTGGNGITGAPHDPDGVGPIVAGTRWNENHWNSARMDTVERNMFPCLAVDVNIGDLKPGQYASQYHESDPKFTTLGVPKNRCFVKIPNGALGQDHSNTTCGEVPYPPAWTASPSTGFNANEIPGMPGKTREYTKIIPDGMLTPGAHVQYFFRKSTIGQSAFEMVPDTNFVFPQPGESNFDGHRWQQFGVLPDRWKAQPFGGDGMACMLVVDLGDRRGDELTWVAMSDSIGLTASDRLGAHNGWKATGNDDITVAVGGNDNIAVRSHLGQPGTVWDLYQVKGGESNVPAGRLGSRAAHQATVSEPAFGKDSKHGPTGEMLRSFYRTLVLLAADLGGTSLGPIPDQSDDDIGLFTEFLTLNAPSGTTPRFFLAMGRNLVEGQEDPTVGHPSFFPTFFAAQLRSPDYRTFSGHLVDAVDFTPIPPLNNTGAVYGVFNPCFFTNDLLQVNTAVAGAQAGSFYQDFGTGGPYVASVYAPNSGTRIARTLVEGQTLGSVGSRHLLRTGGLRNHYLNLLTNLYSSLTCGALAAPVGVGDQPGGNPGSEMAQFLSLRSANPMRSGEARITFGLSRTEKAGVKVYDVTGRLVKTVANRIFEGGKEHVVVWDGTDDHGLRVRSGVYFYQLQTRTYVSEKKLTVISN